MQAGKLRHRLTIQSRPTTLGTRGQASKTWNDGETIWGSVQTLSGREAELAKRLYADATHQIEIRYREGITVENQIKFGSRVFGIGAVSDPEQRKINLILLCSEAKN